MTVGEIFGKEKIEYVSVLNISPDDIRRPDILERKGMKRDDVKSAVVFLIPYYVNDGKGNVSRYARSRDYHIYFEDLRVRLENSLKTEFGGEYAGFADKSPIEETSLAVKAGLCIRGDSYVVINEKYGSYVFIGEILSTNEAGRLGYDGNVKSAGTCEHCGMCRKACPMINENMPCLSEITQKKGILEKSEEEYIRKYGYAWGCDICQDVCPHNKNVAETPIGFFRDGRIKNMDKKLLEEMDETEFRSRAFSWRGRDTVIRNAKLFD